MTHELPRLDNFTERVYWLVAKVPEGQVATYGQIAFYAGSYGAARAVGSLMRNSVANGYEVPWQRIVNAGGGISFKGDTARAQLQRQRLRAEGLSFRGAWTFDLAAYQWDPDTAFWGAEP